MDRRGLSGELRGQDRDPGRMAGAGRGTVAAAGRGDHARSERRRAHRELHSALAARQRARGLPRFALAFASIDWLKWLLVAAMLAAATTAMAAPGILAS